MVCQKVIVIALLSVASYLTAVEAQDFVFPGSTERPSRFPLRPTQATTQQGGNTFPSTNGQNVVTNPPQETFPPNNGGDDSTQSPQAAYDACVKQCLPTAEYNPVCGTDGTVYYNPGRLSCAQGCGSDVEINNYGQCETNVRG